MTGRTSWLGLKFIACREALVTVPYRDGGTDELPLYSVGFGSQTNQPKPDDPKVSTIEAFRLLRHNLDIRDGQLRRITNAELSQNEWDALASLHYQASFQASRSIAWLFSIDRRAVPGAFLAWHFKNPGLYARRKREKDIIESGDYGDVSEYKLYDGDPHEVAPVMTPFPFEEEINGQPL